MVKEKCCTCKIVKTGVELRATDDRMCEDCFLKNEKALLELASRKVSDNMNVIVSDTSMAATTALALRNEMLCFIQQKSLTMTVEHLVKLCYDFYRKEEIIAARDIVEQCIGHRMQKRKEPDFARKSTEDIVMACVDPNVSLPVFYATDLSRLPTVDVNHCDVSALLQEIQALRAEVRDMTQLKNEIVQFKEDVKALKQGRIHVDSGTRNVAQLSNIQWPSLPESLSLPAPALAQQVTGMISRTSSANKTEKPLDETRNVRRIQPIYGKAKGQHMKSVDASRRVNILMTRFDPNVTSTDIEALIKDAIPNCTGVKVEKQPTRYDTYSSFKCSAVFYSY